MSAKGAGWPWDALGLAEQPEDSATVRKAYARALKQIDQAQDIAGFSALRQAYEAGLAQCERRKGAKAASPPAAMPEAAAPTAPPTGEALGEPAVAPVPRPAIEPQPKQRLLPDALKDLVADLNRENLLQSVSLRIENALNSPLADEPAVRRAIARQVLRRYRPEPNAMGDLAPDLNALTLKACNERYHWLEDRRAFQADFGSNWDLLSVIALRVYGQMPRAPSHEASPEKEGFWQILRPALPFLAVFLVPRILQALAGDDKQILGYFFYAVLLAGCAWAFGGYAMTHIPNRIIPDRKGAPVMRLAAWVGAVQVYVLLVAAERLSDSPALLGLFILTLAPTGLILGLGLMSFMLIWPLELTNWFRRVFSRKS